MRRVIQHWGMNKIGSTVYSILKGAERDCINKKTIKKIGKFYWPPKMGEIKVRSRDVEGVNKRIDFIDPAEIRQAARMVLLKEYSLPYDSLINQTAKLLGFHRVTSEMYSYMKKGLIPLKTAKVILEKNDRVQLA